MVIDMSRVNNSMKNILTSSGAQFLSIFLKFITRTVFIQTLGVQYLGITGLFTNILSVLALAELGVGSAITFNLYKPIAKNDKNHIIVLMNFYKMAYRVIAAVIAMMGFSLIPFLPILIKDDLSFINVELIFIIYLLQSVTSYLFFAYKSSIIKVNQKDYIVTFITSTFTFINSLAQILILLIYPNFTLYVSVTVLINIIQNIYIAKKADKMFPFINDKTSQSISKTERKEILKNCYAIFLYKINGVILKATDNIVLSTYIGLSIVGIYSNYLLIVNTVKMLLDKLYDGLKASIGNLHASDNLEHEHFIFRVVNYFTFFIYGLASIGTFVCSNVFISVWIGDKFVLSQAFPLLLAIEIYILGLQKFLSTFRTSMGLFQQAKYRPLIGSILNIIISIALVSYIGIYGVLIGTIISSTLTYMWFDPYIIYKHAFNKSVKEYYITNIKYISIVFLSSIISFYLTNRIVNEGVIYLVVGALISITIMLTLIYIFYRKSEEYKYIIKISKRYMNRVKVKLYKN